MQFLRHALILIAIAGAAGCDDDSAVVSGTLDGQTLSAQQIASLNDWLRTHESAWTGNLATPPVPSHVIAVRQASGKVQSIDLFDQAGWKQAVLREGRIRVLAANEAESLRQALGLRASADGKSAGSSD